MFDEARLAVIDRDLAFAQQGDRDAQIRVLNSHVSWLLHFARYVNMKVAEYEAEMADTEETENVQPEDDQDETVLAPLGVISGDEEDVVAEPGSPTALAEDAAIAEANENEDANESDVVENEGDPVASEDSDPVDNLPTPSDDPSENEVEENGEEE